MFLQELIKNQMQRILDDLNSGNSNINEDDEKELLDCLIRIGEPMISKYKAIKYINCSPATFDRLVASGKLPEGSREAGFKEKFWKKSDIKEYIKRMKQEKEERKK